ncbi:ATP-binding protein [Clostridium culturomicium]|uniref:ATP-binding protein n=1 Tax=Clostridium culturomicium TaxID=1499683 RepID=UPI00058D8314|nr:ATP-binding protein [Clostridium culturomicium]
MINNHHLQVMKIYDDIKESQKRALEGRKEEVRRKIPEVEAIEREIGKLCIKVSINALQDIPNREDHLRSLKESITTLRMRKTELLVSNGFPMDYLDLHYSCNKCKDTGYIGLEKCSCYKQKLNKLYYKNSDLFTVSDKNNFANFSMDFYSNKNEGPEKYSPRENMKKIVNGCLKFMSNFESTDENILFYGNSGTGKTFLSHCMAKELIDSGYFVVYKTAEELIKNLRDVRFNNNSTLEDHLINCDLLIIDDLGTELSSEFSKAELFNLLNTKLLRNKKMLISTNYSLDELLSLYSERITSRLFGNFTLYKFYGKDIRLQKKLSN